MMRTDKVNEGIAAIGRQAGLVAKEIQDASGPLADSVALRASVDHRSGCLLLLGDPGTGKSLAAARWLLQPAADLARWGLPEAEGGTFYPPSGYRPVWRSARSLARVKQYDELEVSELIKPPRLVIDDLGVEYQDAKGFLLSLIDEIVTERHRRDLPTVLTGNLSGEEFAERYGARIVDRIKGSGRLVACVGDSFRGASPLLTVPPLVTEAGIDAAIAVAKVRRREREREHAEQMRADEERRARFNAARESDRLATEAAKLAGKPESMSPAEVEARRAELAAQLAKWQAANGTEGTST